MHSEREMTEMGPCYLQQRVPEQVMLWVGNLCIRGCSSQGRQVEMDETGENISGHLLNKFQNL